MKPLIKLPKSSSASPSSIRGKRAHLVVYDEVKQEPRIPQPDWDKLEYYSEALHRLKSKVGASGAWQSRYDALTSTRSYKRWFWLKWVEEQARTDNGPEWCKQLVTAVVTLKLSQE